MDRSGIREVRSGRLGRRYGCGLVGSRERKGRSFVFSSFARNDLAAWAAPVGFAFFGILSFFCGESKT